MKPFLEQKEPSILSIAHGLIAIFKPAGWHSTFQRGGQESYGALNQPGSKESKDMVSWISSHSELLPQSELKDAAKVWRSHFADFQAQIQAQNTERFLSELGMLYRLDRETSGIMLFALDRATLESMRAAQNAFMLKKRYILMSTASDTELKGSLPKSKSTEREGLLSALYRGNPMTIVSYFRSYGERGRLVSCIDPSFRLKTRKEITKNQYKTDFLAAKTMHWPISNAICLEAAICKGFRHQIRAHCAWMGLPIIGDSLYGGSLSERLWLEAFSVSLVDGDQSIAEWKLHDGIAALLQQ